MTPEKWQGIKDQVKRNFTLEQEGEEDLLAETTEGQVKQGEAEFVVFSGPLGRLKLQFQKKPKLEQKKYFYSKREGDAARVEYKFSDQELVYAFKAYKWDEIEEEWEEIEAERFAFTGPNY